MTEASLRPSFKCLFTFLNTFFFSFMLFFGLPTWKLVALYESCQKWAILISMLCFSTLAHLFDMLTGCLIFSEYAEIMSCVDGVSL